MSLVDAVQAKSAKKVFFLIKKKKRKGAQFIPEEEEEKKKSIGSYRWAVVRGRDKGAAAGERIWLLISDSRACTLHLPTSNREEVGCAPLSIGFRCIIPEP